MTSDEDDFFRHAELEMFPKMRDTNVVMSIVPTGKPDPKFCLELGAAIMFEKPIIAVVLPGTHVPEMLRKVADEVVECDLTTDEGKAVLYAVMQRRLMT